MPIPGATCVSIIVTMSFDQNGDKLIQDLDMGGLALGVNFVF